MPTPALSSRLQQLIYMDHNSLSVCLPEVCDVLREEALSFHPRNPSSIHLAGREGKRAIDEARHTCLECLGCGAGGFDAVFTSSCTEANNIALLGGGFAKVFSLITEHPSVVEPLQVAKNCEFLPLGPGGAFDLSQLEDGIMRFRRDFGDSAAFCVSAMIANNETGLLHDLASISRIAHEYGGVVHSDISQGVGKMEIDLNLLGVDIATLSSGKVRCAPGAGLLVLRNGIKLKPISFGGGQEKFLRPGTYGLPMILALATALRIVTNIEYIAEYRKKTLEMQQYMEDRLVDLGGVIACRAAPRLTNTTMVCMPGVDSSVQLIEFDTLGFMVSNGSACSSGTVRGSRVMSAIPENAENAAFFVRISLDSSNTMHEASAFVNAWHSLRERTLGL